MAPPQNAPSDRPDEPVASDALASFRVEVARWLVEHCPPTMRTPPEGEADEVWGGRKGKFRHPDQKLWLERAAQKGYTAPTWPVEYGGAGLDGARARILDEEMRRLGCRPPLKSLGVWMLGPALLEHGSEEQKREHLPKMARGEIRWCQGYSEPGAGSDLASLSTSAVRDGDEYVVNGQKIWTSHADKADFLFCLVRTDPRAKKHDGISFLLIDLDTPGVTVRPITLLSGASHFCETFLVDVRVPARNLVGLENEGWTIAKAVLTHERTAISALRDAAVQEEEPLYEQARRYVGVDDRGALADPILRDRITQTELDALCNRLTLRRSADNAASGKGPGPESSMTKLYGTELNQRRKELRVVIQGYRGLGWEGGPFTAEELQHTRDWLRSRANTIEGGTSEIQLNVIAKRVLGLPD